MGRSVPVQAAQAPGWPATAASSLAQRWQTERSELGSVPALQSVQAPLDPPPAKRAGQFSQLVRPLLGCVPVPHTLQTPPVPAALVAQVVQAVLPALGAEPSAQVVQTPPVPASVAAHGSQAVCPAFGAVPLLHCVQSLVPSPMCVARQVQVRPLEDVLPLGQGVQVVPTLLRTVLVSQGSQASVLLSPPQTPVRF